jgi:hypothetical protein
VKSEFRVVCIYRETLPYVHTIHVCHKEQCTRSGGADISLAGDHISSREDRSLQLYNRMEGEVILGGKDGTESNQDTIPFFVGRKTFRLMGLRMERHISFCCTDFPFLEALA